MYATLRTHPSAGPSMPLQLGLIAATAVLLGIGVGWFGLLGGVGVSVLAIGALLFLYPACLPALFIGAIALGEVARFAPNGGAGAILLLDLLAALICLLGFLRRPLSSPLFRRPVGVIWAAFLAVSLISLLLTPLGLGRSELLTNGFYWFRLFAYSGIIWAFPLILTDRAAPGRILNLVMGVGVAVAVIGFIQLYVFPDIGLLHAYGWDPHLGRLVSTFLDPNFLGGFLAIILALLGSTYLVYGKASPLLWASMVVVLLASVLTYSRSGYLAVAIVVLLLGLRYSWKLLVIAIVCVTPLALAVPRVQQRVVGGFSVDVTAQDRIDSWRTALDLGGHYPLVGFGYNNYRSAQEEFGVLQAGSTNHSGAGSDSSILTVFDTTGALGLSLFLTAIFLLLLDCRRLLQRKEKNPATVAALTLYTVAPAMAVHAMFVNGFFFPFILAILCSLIAVRYWPEGRG